MRILAVSTRAVLVASVLYACGGASSSGDGSPGSSAGSDASVALDGSSVHGDASVGVGDASSSPDASTDAATAPLGCDAGTCGSLVGHVSRKSTTMAQHGGVGNVYIAVFDGNPIADQANAKVVAQTVLMNVDLGASSASFAYRVDGIPVRAAEYQVVAFLDDDHNASATNPAPSKGDLVTIDLMAFGGVKAPVTKSGDTTLDLQLNAALP
jgi:hypothetical protein